MTNENDLIQKLMVSKAIMDKHNHMGRNSDPSMSAPMVESYDSPPANYNLPEEFAGQGANLLSERPKQPMTQDKILSSKLPDEIKRLMIEHPINQPNSMEGPTLSNELVDKASRLMGTQKQPIKENNQRQPQTQNIPDTKMLRAMLKEVVEEVLTENGILAESSQKSNEVFSFKVGKHIFEGKVTKIKKLS